MNKFFSKEWLKYIYPKKNIYIYEMFMRDGLQSLEKVYPLEKKIYFINNLMRCNIKNIEFTFTDKFQKIISKHFINIIRFINKNIFNDRIIDLLGVSFSRGVCIFISQEIKVRKLNLMCPAIYFDKNLKEYKGLLHCPTNQYICLTWCCQDTKISYTEIGDKLIKQLEENFEEFISIKIDTLYDEKDHDNTHRLHNIVFNLI
jgi:hypothetical protein